MNYVDENYPVPVLVPDFSSVQINAIILEFPDGDGLDDQWELQYVDSLGLLSDNGDYDHDGYTDLQEWQNQQNGVTDRAGNVFDPTVSNIGLISSTSFLPAIYRLLLLP